MGRDPDGPVFVRGEGVEVAFEKAGGRLVELSVGRDGDDPEVGGCEEIPKFCVRRRSVGDVDGGDSAFDRLFAEGEQVVRG